MQLLLLIGLIAGGGALAVGLERGTAKATERTVSSLLVIGIIGLVVWLLFLRKR